MSSCPEGGFYEIGRAPRGEMAIEIIERVFAPEGLHDSARGFNRVLTPGTDPHRTAP